MDRLFFAIGAFSAFAAIAAGAMGSHALRDKLSADMLDIFEIAVRYHIYHSLALLAVAWATTAFSGWWSSAAGWLFCAGIILFSGSLYILALTGVRWLGMITPLGGIAFLAGWIALAVAAIRR
ncbi:MAG: hypothetical protein A2Z34_02555 [Planctomycetes bacterium RBG_16_59_8]|nr:MAG: hypothetical protein A2Z34_02555 [Planctomycetes bacterium RBG_16_59_8]